MLKKIKLKKKKSGARKLSIKMLLTAQLPEAISGRINPILAMGCAAVIAAVITLPFAALRRAAPLLAVIGSLVIIYALWQKAEVLRNGYDEYLFKVIDYTYIAPIRTSFISPTGMLLLNRTEGFEHDQNTYHVAIAGKATQGLPPVDWIIRVYVPKGSVAASFGDRKYFPVVYGYRIEGEDR